MQVGRAGEDRDERGHVEAERAPRLDVGRVVGADLVAHAIGEESRVEGADPAEESDQLRVDDLGRGRRRREIEAEIVQFVPPWQFWQPGASKSCAADLCPDVVTAAPGRSARGRRGPGRWRWRRDRRSRPVLARAERDREAARDRRPFRHGGAIGIDPDQPAAAGDGADVALKSCTSSRTADQFSARWCESGSAGAPFTITAAPNVERALHRDRLARAVGEHPRHACRSGRSGGSCSRCPSR